MTVGRMMSAKSKLKQLGANIRYSLTSAPFSELTIVSEKDAWSLACDVEEVYKICQRLNFPVRTAHWAGVFRQPLFYLSKYFLLQPGLHLHGMNRVAMAYYHGYPGSDEIADRCLASLRRYHHKIARIQVTHQRIRDVLLEQGVAEEKLHMIPIGIDIELFTAVTDELRAAARERLGIPEAAFLVGSFQKDGVGWGDGLVPKRIKGPDILVETLARAKQRIPELWVLLTGPARGYVKAQLDRLGIPYRHLFLQNFKELPACYHALDAYLVSSREEGGPKAVLESMATGVPVVSTPVGQASHLIRSGVNGLLASGFSPEELAGLLGSLYGRETQGPLLRANGFKTARENAYSAQLSLWKQFWSGIIE